jgi:hypothetical protein
LCCIVALNDDKRGAFLWQLIRGKVDSNGVEAVRWESNSLVGNGKGCNGLVKTFSLIDPGHIDQRVTPVAVEIEISAAEIV